ncbi:hypothetical protein MTR_3g448730 [Medicago truncatula]|uniref:RNA-directed DNA polymerase n=1 Tax=Medicago truncatula TaxID=3880 RepID=A0A072UVE6_MEDTR|nr:hypothetical protein MTR_3g448730 [Medicago truncatula]
MSLDLSNNPKTREVYSLTFIVDKEKKRENIKVNSKKVKCEESDCSGKEQSREKKDKDTGSYPGSFHNTEVVQSPLHFQGDFTIITRLQLLNTFKGPKTLLTLSWASKRQATIAMSTAEAEYISAASCCTQLLWMKHQLEDYQINANSIPIFCDNTAAICLSKNPILHSRAKHIEIKHHFIRDYVQKGILDIQFIDTEHQWADIFTKPLSVERFDFIKKNLNMHFVSD